MDSLYFTYAMLIPTAGLVIGLIIAVFVSYRKLREYTRDITIEETPINKVNKKINFSTVLALIAELVAQLQHSITSIRLDCYYGVIK